MGMTTKSLFSILAVCFLVTTAFAIPAPPDLYTNTQPDGSRFTARLMGDENLHFEVTEDGFLIEQGLFGNYVYLDENGEPSKFSVHEPNERTGKELEFLNSLDRDRVFESLKAKNPVMDDDPYRVPDFAKRNMLPEGLFELPSPNPNMVRGKKRGMVVLVQFPDVKFTNPNPRMQFINFMNKKGYSEYYNKGSARDYFIQNSMGQYEPAFDVYGPVTLPENHENYGDSSEYNKGQSTKHYAARLGFSIALDSLLKQGNVDFSIYDNDGDGTVDFVFFIFAGLSASTYKTIPAAAKSIWPFSWSFYPTKKDPNSGIKFSKFACAQELDSHAYEKDPSKGTLGGVGTFVHEFSHVLGLPDLYVSTYAHRTLSSWDVMDQGVYNCPTNAEGTTNCAPPFYSAFERMSMGWMMPPELNDTGTVHLDKIGDNAAYRVTNKNNSDEFYVLEYRTHKEWDVGQKKSGMMIWHIDYSDAAWAAKGINDNKDHQHVDLIEAVAPTSTKADVKDLFPGESKITSFNNFVMWDGSSREVFITNIAESEDSSYVTFKATMSVDGSISSSSSAAYSSVTENSSSSEFVITEECVEFVNGNGDFEGHCYESGLQDMESGKCYALNPEIDFVLQSVPDVASDEYWWVEVPCVIGSSSSEEQESSSSQEYLDSSSSEWYVWSSSDFESSSSEEQESSSSEVEVSSSEEFVESSSSEVQESSSSYEYLESSSSQWWPWNDEESSSSVEESSSSQYDMALRSGDIVGLAQIHVLRNEVSVYVPQQGRKRVLFFSMTGNLLFAQSFTETNAQFQIPRNLWNSPFIISVEHNGQILTTRRR